MANILPDNEIIEFENQQYVNPQVSLDESTAFIENLRSSQAARNAEIGQETARLGAYPAPQSNLGGLGGGGSYFEARYSTPQGVALANNLRATAQAQALNDVLSNEQAMMKQRYQKARDAYIRRQNTPTSPENPDDDGIEEEANDTDALTTQGKMTMDLTQKVPSGVKRVGIAPGHSGDDYFYTYDYDIATNTRKGLVETDNPAYARADNGYLYKVGTENNWFSGSPESRANNMAQLEKIRAVVASQGK